MILFFLSFIIICRNECKYLVENSCYGCDVFLWWLIFSSLLYFAYLFILFFTSQLHIDSHHDPTSPTTKEEVDFFKEHVDIIDSNPLSDNQKLFSSSEPQPIKNGNIKKEEFGKTWLNSTGF